MLVYLLIALLGLAAGVLINYLADTLPYSRRLVQRSCLACGKAQSGILAYLWPSRCERCGYWQPLRTWLVHIAAIGASSWLWASSPPALGFTLSFILMIYFAVVVVIDLEHRLILHPTSLVGALLGLFLGTYLHGLGATLLGGAAGFISMLAFYVLGGLFARLIMRLRGHVVDEEALGFGDVILTGVLGLLLGWPGILLGLFLGIMAGGLASLVYIVVMAASRRYRPFTAIPYGPFLISGAAALLYFREYILAYLNR
jgi:prepilin signal peptidase PulO-like enzyme (type II secretory pathway)